MKSKTYTKTGPGRMHKYIAKSKRNSYAKKVKHYGNWTKLSDRLAD